MANEVTEDCMVWLWRHEITQFIFTGLVSGVYCFHRYGSGGVSEFHALAMYGAVAGFRMYVSRHEHAEIRWVDLLPVWGTHKLESFHSLLNEYLPRMLSNEVNDNNDNDNSIHPRKKISQSRLRYWPLQACAKVQQTVDDVVCNGHEHAPETNGMLIGFVGDSGDGWAATKRVADALCGAGYDDDRCHLLIFGGDAVYPYLHMSYLKRLTDPFEEALGTRKLPTLTVVGNHDMYAGVESTSILQSAEHMNPLQPLNTSRRYWVFPIDPDGEWVFVGLSLWKNDDLDATEVDAVLREIGDLNKCKIRKFIVVTHRPFWLLKTDLAENFKRFIYRALKHGSIAAFLAGDLHNLSAHWQQCWASVDQTAQSTLSELFRDEEERRKQQDKEWEEERDEQRNMADMAVESKFDELLSFRAKKQGSVLPEDIKEYFIKYKVDRQLGQAPVLFLVCGGGGAFLHPHLEPLRPAFAPSYLALDETREKKLLKKILVYPESEACRWLAWRAVAIPVCVPSAWLLGCGALAFTQHVFCFLRIPALVATVEDRLPALLARPMSMLYDIVSWLLSENAEYPLTAHLEQSWFIQTAMGLTYAIYQQSWAQKPISLVIRLLRCIGYSYAGSVFLYCLRSGLLACKDDFFFFLHNSALVAEAKCRLSAALAGPIMTVKGIVPWVLSENSKCPLISIPKPCWVFAAGLLGLGALCQKSWAISLSSKIRRIFHMISLPLYNVFSCCCDQVSRLFGWNNGATDETSEPLSDGPFDNVQSFNDTVFSMLGVQDYKSIIRFQVGEVECSSSFDPYPNLSHLPFKRRLIVEFLVRDDVDSSGEWKKYKELELPFIQSTEKKTPPEVDRNASEEEGGAANQERGLRQLRIAQFFLNERGYEHEILSDLTAEAKTLSQENIDENESYDRRYGQHEKVLYGMAKVVTLNDTAEVQHLMSHSYMINYPYALRKLQKRFPLQQINKQEENPTEYAEDFFWVELRNEEDHRSTAAAYAIHNTDKRPQPPDPISIDDLLKLCGPAKELILEWLASSSEPLSLSDNAYNLLIGMLQTSKDEVLKSVLGVLKRVFQSAEANDEEYYGRLQSLLKLLANVKYNVGDEVVKVAVQRVCSVTKFVGFVFDCYDKDEANRVWWGELLKRSIFNSDGPLAEVHKNHFEEDFRNITTELVSHYCDVKGSELVLICVEQFLKRNNNVSSALKTQFKNLFLQQIKRRQTNAGIDIDTKPIERLLTQ